MVDRASPRSAGSLFKELLLTRAITVATTPDGSAPSEGALLDAVTVIQLDGDVINYIREGASLERHFAALRQVRAALRLSRACWLATERSVFWTVSLGGQYFAHAWFVDALLGGAPDWSALLGETRHLVSSLLGFALPFALHGFKLFVRTLVLRRFERAAVDSPNEVLSGRRPRPA